MRKKKLLKVATGMRALIGTTPCKCVETQEYTDYQDDLRKQLAGKDPFEKLLISISNRSFDPADTLEQECERCRLIDEFDRLTGDYEELTYIPVSDEEFEETSKRIKAMLSSYQERKDK
jgi:hypothetical protein